MSPSIVALVLLAALLHASWNAMAKSGGSAQYSIASYRLVSALCCLPLLFYFPLPLAASWTMLLASTVIHTDRRYVHKLLVPTATPRTFTVTGSRPRQGPVTFTSIVSSRDLLFSLLPRT